MNSTKRHKKTRLSSNGDCRVVFCPDCGVLEINLGASTIRTNCESLHILSSVLNHAKARLDQMQNATLVHGDAPSVSMNRVH